MSNLGFKRNQIWTLAWPVMAAGLSQSILMVTDTAFLGHLGEVELGAGGLANLWYFMLLTVSMGLGTGLQVMTSRRIAGGKYKSIGRVVNHGLMLGGAFSVVTMLFLQFAMPHILSLYLVSDEVLEATLEYLSIRMWDMPFVYFTIMLRGFYTGVGQNRIVMWSTLLTAVLNIVLCLFLVAGLWGFPSLGMAGAALSTVIAQAAGAFLVLGHLYHYGYVRKFHLFRREKQRGYIYRLMLSLSGPTIMQYILSMLGFLYLMYEIEKLGERSLAVSELVKTTYLTLMIPIWGFQAAAGTLVSYAIGAGHNMAVLPILRRISSMSFVCIAVISLPLFLAPDYLFRLYTHNPDILAMARVPGYIVGVGLVLLSVGSVFMSGVIGTGATRFALYAEIILISAYCLYIALAAHVWEPSLGRLWGCEFIYMGGMVTLFSLYLRSGRWKGREV
ncbi:MAG: MATE family efflux transporter [Bacteroidetes bacterium]|nr:MATE family efflux transporter [Bacteroidota bacterium]